MNHAATIVCRPIGIVHSRFESVEGMPIQTVAAPQEVAQLEIFSEFLPGLRDVEHFEYLIVLTHLHRAEQERLDVVPFMDQQSHGIFATRAPVRPNRIGFSIIKLESVQGNRLHFSGNAMMNQTPVLDIKPYVPRLDVRDTNRIGWFADRVDQLVNMKSDTRMR